MVYTIVMDGKKNLKMIKPGVIYQGENNCDTIRFLVPYTYGVINLESSSVLLNWIFHYYDDLAESEIESTPDTDGNIKLLTLVPSEEKEGYLTCNVPISVKYTSRVCNIELWLEVKTEDSVLLKTNTVFFQVNPHVNITNYIEDGEIDLLSDLLIKMEQLQNTCNAAMKTVEEQAEKATIAATTIIELLEKWEDEHGTKI